MQAAVIEMAKGAPSDNSGEGVDDPSLLLEEEGEPEKEAAVEAQPNKEEQEGPY